MSNNNHDNVQFLKEQPLQKEELKKCKFGHKEIAAALTKIISSCPSPFTIGLFGRWGSGKSTIANQTKENLDAVCIPSIYFDVWKHEGDALRRTFLKEIIKQLNIYGKVYFDGSFKIDERLESSVTKTSEGKFKLNLDKIRQASIASIIFLITLVVVGGISSYFGYIQQFLSFIFFSLSVIFGGSFLVWLLNNATQFLTTETVTFGTDRFQDPYEFENEFSKVLSKLKKDRIVIIFDNIDRVTRERALEVLSTIKTFLEPKGAEEKDRKVVFLIPCDAEAIKEHIKGLYEISDNDRSPFDPNEFLKKFFNSILWIPDFILSELGSYAHEALRATKAKYLDQDKVAWIITKAFRENPRQIIQFINTLLANYLLIKERQGKGKDFTSDFLKNNISQLTKYLILNQLFPEEMEELRTKKVVNSQSAIKISLKTKRSSEFINFLNETELDIPISDFKVFFTLRRPEHEKKIPGIETFIAYLEDRKTKDAEEYIEQMGELKEQLKDFSLVIKDELENEQNPVTLTNFISTLLVVLDKFGIQLSPSTYGEIYKSLIGRVQPHIDSISPLVLDRQILKSNKTYINKIIDQWLIILENQKEKKPLPQKTESFIQEVSKVLAENPEYLASQQLEKFQKLLSEAYASNPNILSIFTKKKETQLKFLSPDLVGIYIDSIAHEDVANNLIFKKFEIIKSFDFSNITSEVIKKIIDKFTKIQSEENSKAINDESLKIKTELLDNFREVLKIYSDPMSKVADKSIYNGFSDTIINGINKVNEFKFKKIHIPLLMALENFVHQDKSNVIRNQITAFLDNSSNEDINYILKYIENKVEFFENEPYKQVFINRAQRDQMFFEYYYNNLSKLEKIDILNKLFDWDYNRAITLIEKNKYKVDDKKSVAQKAIEKISAVPVPIKERLFKICIELKVGNENSLKDKLVENIKVQLKNIDKTTQQIGLEALKGAKAFLGKNRTRDLIKDIYDWLKSVELTNKYQASSIRAVCLGYGELDDEEKKEYLQFVFDELIRKGSKEEQINLGFEMLKEINPKYENRKENFDDVKYRIEKESESPLKKMLLNGLFDLKQKAKINAQNKEFWDWVNNQSKNKE